MKVIILALAGCLLLASGPPGQCATTRKPDAVASPATSTRPDICSVCYKAAGLTATPIFADVAPLLAEAVAGRKETCNQVATAPSTRGVALAATIRLMRRCCSRAYGSNVTIDNSHNLPGLAQPG